MITVGYGDIKPINTQERIVAIVSMVLACEVFAYLIGYLGDNIVAKNAFEIRYRETMQSTNQYMKKQKISRKLMFKVRRYIEYVFENQKSHDIDEESILGMLSNPLKYEIYLYTNGKLLVQNYIFADKFDATTVASLTKLLKPCTFAPSDRIFKEGELTRNLYIILTGSINIFDQQTRIQYKNLKPTQQFGEIGFFTGFPRQASASSSEFSDLLKLPFRKIKSALLKVNYYTALFEIILKECEYYNFEFLGIKCYGCENANHIVKYCPNVRIQPIELGKIQHDKEVEKQISKKLNPKSFKRSMRKIRRYKIGARREGWDDISGLKKFIKESRHNNKSFSVQI